MSEILLRCPSDKNVFTKAHTTSPNFYDYRISDTGAQRIVVC